jgi:hypothetical protein
MSELPGRTGLATRGVETHRFFSLMLLSGLVLALAACGSAHQVRAQTTPSVSGADPATSLSAIQAKIASNQAKIARDMARLKALEAHMPSVPGAVPNPFPGSGSLKSWNKPGVYKWVVPAGVGFIEIAAYGGSGGGGNSGWVRAPGVGRAYTCENESKCFGAGGGGGGASAVLAAGSPLVLAPGGGGGGGGIFGDAISGGAGGNGGSAAEVLPPVFFSVVSSRRVWVGCRPHCLHDGEVLTIFVGGGGGGASGNRPGKGGFGYGGPGGSGGVRCGGAGGSGGRYGGGGGGGGACVWDRSGGMGGSGAYGGGGGAGTLGGESCYEHGGAGGGFIGEGAPSGTWRHPYGENGSCGGGRGGTGLEPAVVRPGAGMIVGGRGGQIQDSVAQNGKNGDVVITIGGSHG